MLGVYELSSALDLLILQLLAARVGKSSFIDDSKDASLSIAYIKRIKLSEMFRFYDYPKAKKKKRNRRCYLRRVMTSAHLGRPRGKCHRMSRLAYNFFENTEGRVTGRLYIFFIHIYE